MKDLGLWAWVLESDEQEAKSRELAGSGGQCQLHSTQYKVPRARRRPRPCDDRAHSRILAPAFRGMNDSKGAEGRINLW